MPQVLNDGENKGVFRQILNDNFAELSDASEENRNSISALQNEATAKWVLLNTVDNRSRASELAIAELREILARNGIT